ncbi:isochorismatase family protein [Pseudonocardia sp. K10HN5]|uniref:Isochorismatase family protein n=1 Tax=Pseudonocardia acidicola TaxID=2724939 RepID=A0ABX1SPC1_9PSEU|nr:isochorismatase family protein [Pseudonocardia acidicola]NMI02287.1 isochorismatase family protein [Pseudonocardia acidicola]
MDDVRERYAARGLGGRLQPGARPAVVVIDLIRGFTDPACSPGSDLSAVVAATRQVLDVARAADVPVVFTSITFAAAELDTTLWLVKMPAMRALLAGSKWVEVDDRLARRQDEAVITKQAASGFNGTDLAGRLAAAGADSLVLCGATTSGCIRATAIDACALGIPTFVPRECVGDRAAGPHEANLLDIDAKYADVIDLADALALLRAPVADTPEDGR